MPSQCRRKTAIPLPNAVTQRPDLLQCPAGPRRATPEVQRRNRRQSCSDGEENNDAMMTRSCYCHRLTSPDKTVSYST